MARRRDRSGREERRAKSKARRPQLSRFYRNRLKDVRPGDFEFKLTLIRGGRTRRINLDSFVTDFSWSDEESVLTGAVTLRRPDADDPRSLVIGTGYRIRCHVRHAGRWYELWTMRCSRPRVDPIEGTIEVDLKDDLVGLRRSKRKWSFRKTKRRKKGWNAAEVTREVCRREGVKIRSLPEARHRMDKLELTGSALDVIKKAWAHERDKSGRRFFIRMRDGKLEVVPYRRNRILYTLGAAIEGVELEETQAERPVTVIIAKGRIGKGKGAKKVRHTEYRRAIVRRFGYIPEEKDYGRVRSHRDLKLRARRDLAKKIRVKRQGRVSTPGIPFIRRGEGMRYLSKEPGWHGGTDEIRDRTYVFTTDVHHHVSGGGEYTTDFGFIQEDPFVKDRERREKEARERKKRERGKRRRGDS
ncbi:MAG TPA: hypothetical protein VF192_01240 [Longimicrobiales bacterium]